MTQNEGSERTDAGQRAGSSEADLQERVTQLLRRRSKLSADEAVLLREVVFPTIVKAHKDQVSKYLRTWDLVRNERDDLFQETFLTLFKYILETGFPDKTSGMLQRIVEGKVSDYKRIDNRAPVTLGVPSSSAETPRSGPDVNFTLDIRKLARRLLPLLSREHQEVINKVVVNDLTHIEAAAALGIPEGTVKSRLLAAKRALHELAAPLLPASQRGLV